MEKVSSLNKPKENLKPTPETKANQKTPLPTYQESNRL